ncbi:MAG: metallophosphoesterase [Saprospiraceae bacterium]|nr:metallophosphoesterase [Saprospiraceae bacterium]
MPQISIRLVTAILLVLLLSSCGAVRHNFSFFAIGDMPYEVPNDYARFERVIASINGENPAFTVHVGDIKGGSTPCTEEVYKRMYDYYQTFNHPFILTPGDNDWTDCHREGAGGYDPVDRLEKFRTIFYKNNKSLGQDPIDLLTQSTYEGFEKFVENSIWEREDVLFATFHVVGSNNHYKQDSTADQSEFEERDAADLFWLKESFDQARSRGSRGLVLILHAAMNFSDSDQSGFRNFTRKLRQEVLRYDNPILMIYGDHHRFLISKPLDDNAGRVVPNFTSVMVFGNPDMHAVKITVNRNYESLFEIRQHLVNTN